MSKGCARLPKGGLVTFDERCYALLRQIPKGRVSSYREIAQALECKAYRAVGNAMNKNPYPKEEYPCHRILKSNGSVGGYASGTEKKIEMLRAEGLEIEEERVIGFDDLLMRASEFKVSRQPL